MDALSGLYTLDPVVVAVAVGVLAGLLLFATGAMVLLILQHAARAREIADLRGRAEAAMEEARLAGSAGARAETALAPVRAVAQGRAGPWARRPVTPPGEHRARRGAGIPVIGVVDPAGGALVAAALARAFDDRGERVLAVDLDAAGGLSALLDAEIGAGTGDATALLSPDAAAPEPRRVAGTRALTLIPAGPDLATAEFALWLRWLSERSCPDLRFALARHLLGGAVQSAHDRVIVSAPARFLPGTVNAVSAATHLLLPIAGDAGSSAAAERLLGERAELPAAVVPGQQRVHAFAWPPAGGAGAQAAAAARVATLAARVPGLARLRLRGTSAPDARDRDDRLAGAVADLAPVRAAVPAG